MEKDQKILLGLIAFIFVAAIVIVIYLFTEKNKVTSDALKFKNEYELLNDMSYENKDKYLNVKIDNQNVFKYSSDEEIIDVMKKKTAIIFFGFAKCPYCRSMVSLLNDIAKKNNINSIYYVDILNIRDSYEVIDDTAVKLTSGTTSYYKILDYLDNYLSDYYVDDVNTGVKRLYAPTVIAVKEGKVVDFHEGTIDGAKYNKKLTEEEQKELKEIYQRIINNLDLNK